MLEQRNWQTNSASEIKSVRNRIEYRKSRKEFIRCCVYMLIKLRHTEWKTAQKFLDLFFLIIRSWSVSVSLFLSYTIVAVKFVVNILQRAWCTRVNSLTVVNWYVLSMTVYWVGRYIVTRLLMTFKMKRAVG